MAIHGGEAKEYHGAGIYDWRGHSGDSQLNDRFIASMGYDLAAVAAHVRQLWDFKLKWGMLSPLLCSATDPFVFFRDFPTFPQRYFSCTGVLLATLALHNTTASAR